MKRNLFLLPALATIALVNAQEVQPVVEITPKDAMATETPAELLSSSRPEHPDLEQIQVAEPAVEPLVLPTPPAEVKSTDLAVTSTINKPMAPQSKKAAAKPAKKPVSEMTTEEKMDRLEHKINKLRTRSHADRAAISTLQKQVAKLKMKIKEPLKGEYHV